MFFALGSANGPPSRLPDSSKLPAWRRDSLGGSATPSAGLPRESLGFDLLAHQQRRLPQQPARWWRLLGV